MALTTTLANVVLVGAGATLVMDVWLALIKRLGVPTLNFALLGRWVGHLFRGRFAHDAIGKASPIPGELAIGWIAHYAIGIAFAGLLVGVYGVGWIVAPSLLPALTVGVATVAAPLLVMQPAMGSGFAAFKTPAPLRNCVRSVVNHAVFGVGLYLAARLVAGVAR